MALIEILHGGILTSIQDNGRYGYQYYGIPKSGGLDINAMFAANKLLDNPIGTAMLECNIMACSILFHESINICLSGADMHWSINGRSINRYQIIQAQKGDILKGKSTINGMRAYIAFQGEIDTDLFYGSYSYYPIQQYNKNGLLKKGQKINIKPRSIIFKNPIATNQKQIDYNSIHQIAIRKGPEWYLLADKNNFIKQYFTISPHSNRMGAALKGKAIYTVDYPSMSSVPVFPGIIQLPPNGTPIVLLNDAQSTGGYPRIAYIPKEDLTKFVQIRMGQEFRFVM